MYRTAGIQPEVMKLLVVRAPGPLVADPSQLPWRPLRAGLHTRPNGPAFARP